MLFRGSLKLLGQEVQKRTMRNNNDMVILPTTARNLANRPPRLPRPGHNLVLGGLKGTVGAKLVVPALPHARQVRLGAKLGRRLLLGRARVRRHVRELLQGVERGDGVGRAGPVTKRLDAGVQGAAHGRGDEVRDAVVVGEGGTQVGALLVAEGRQVRVWEALVFEAEVVIALRVADEVDCGRHGLCSLVQAGTVDVVSYGFKLLWSVRVEEHAIQDLVSLTLCTKNGKLPGLLKPVEVPNFLNLLLPVTCRRSLRSVLSQTPLAMVLRAGAHYSVRSRRGGAPLLGLNV